MMLVLLYGLAHNTYPALKPRQFSTLKPRLAEHPDTQTVSFFFQAEDGIRDAQESRGLGDVYKRQTYVGVL